MICAVAVAAFVVGIVGCAPKANPGNPTPQATKAEVTPEPDKFGVVEADQWKDIYPHQYASYLENADNTPPWDEYKDSEDTTSKLPEGYQPTDSHKANYLELYPEIKTLGKGYGYAKYYTEPAGHVYSLWTVTHNGRVNDKTKAGCIACKTPQFSNMVDEQGDG
ncbi:MAG: ammonia-forming cytochrome c nitrite reductase subunit c552, partial [Coriobacteriaceae bacterium]|nr:ammonia-forming cytochrome c nitrite reductase subunit c552 [Coriobacteriaceae bacterium]